MEVARMAGLADGQVQGGAIPILFQGLNRSKIMSYGFYDPTIFCFSARVSTCFSET